MNIFWESKKRFAKNSTFLTASSISLLATLVLSRQKYDIEYWSPVDQKYREITSCSNCTDYQARNLNIRVRRTDGQIEVLHTLNGTAISLARTLVAIIENYARKMENWSYLRFSDHILIIRRSSNDWKNWNQW